MGEGSNFMAVATSLLLQTTLISACHSLAKRQSAQLSRELHQLQIDAKLTMSLFNHVIYLSSTILIAACFWPVSSQQEDITQPEVTIPQGTLQGTTLTTRRNRTVSAFLAIPYAQPPIGNLRFANPVAADGWTGTLNASVDGNACPQFSGTAIGAEDCLNINVYTPQLPKNSSFTLLPVMVWIYGGAFIVGSHNSAKFGPEYLLDADVVLAVPNHRVGAFGFLSTGDEVASGNWGLKDQLLALQWVQNNIMYFGGDPDQVTIFGQSAGAVSIHLLTLSDATIGLFHRYITQSGSGLATWGYQPKAAYASRAFELGEYVGCSNDTSASLVTCLRSINASDILASYSQFYVWKSLPVIIWSPTDEPDIDGAILTDNPANIIAAGGIRDLPWITGIVRDEGVRLTSSFYDDEEEFTDFLDNFDTLLSEMLTLTYQSDSGAAWVKAIKSYYFNNDLTTNKSETLTNLTGLVSDALFFYPNHKALQQQFATAVNPQYYYTFNYRGSLSYSLQMTGSLKDYGVVHSDDLIYIFPNSELFSTVHVTRSESDFQMVDAMVELWTSFAINGTPTTSANDNTVAWGIYSTEDNYLRVGNNSDLSLEVQHSFFKERMQFWDSLVSATSTSDAVTTYPHLFLSLLLLSLKLMSICLPMLTNELV